MVQGSVRRDSHNTGSQIKYITLLIAELWNKCIIRYITSQIAASVHIRIIIQEYSNKDTIEVLSLLSGCAGTSRLIFHIPARSLGAFSSSSAGSRRRYGGAALDNPWQMDCFRVQVKEWKQFLFQHLYISFPKSCSALSLLVYSCNHTCRIQEHIEQTHHESITCLAFASSLLVSSGSKSCWAYYQTRLGYP